MSGNLEDMRAYARGYEDGRRSKDADHAAAVLRLSRLTFDGGSHENLSKIAYAIYPCATGWTCESAKGLRDRLIDLLGGVHEHHCNNGRGCACGDSRTGDSGEHAKAMTYDVLGNERHKAVCRLRYIRDCLKGDSTCNSLNIADAIGAKLNVGDRLHESICDRLIYLLGGDEKYFYVSVREDGSIDRRADQSHESSPMSLENETGISDRTDETNFTKIAETINLDGKHDNELMENGENHKIATITDELRECVETATKTYEGSWYEMNDADHTICHITEGELTRIADRIEEQFARVCELWERTATDTAQGIHDDMEAECNRLQAECDRLTTALDELHADPANDVICRLERERDELRDKLEEADAAIANWRERERSFDESERERKKLQDELKELEEFEPDIAMTAYGDDNDELRRLLYRAAKLLANAEQDRDTNYAYWMDCKEKVVQANATIDELQAKLDAIREALDGNH